MNNKIINIFLGLAILFIIPCCGLFNNAVEVISEFKENNSFCIVVKENDSYKCSSKFALGVKGLTNDGRPVLNITDGYLDVNFLEGTDDIVDVGEWVLLSNYIEEVKDRFFPHLGIRYNKSSSPDLSISFNSPLFNNQVFTTPNVLAAATMPFEGYSIMAFNDKDHDFSDPKTPLEEIFKHELGHSLGFCDSWRPSGECYAHSMDSTLMDAYLILGSDYNKYSDGYFSESYIDESKQTDKEEAKEDCRVNDYNDLYYFIQNVSELKKIDSNEISYWCGRLGLDYNRGDYNVQLLNLIMNAYTD